MTNNKSIKILTTSAKLFATVAVVFIYFHYFSNQSWGFYTIESNIPLYNIYKIKDSVVDKTPLLKNLMSYGMGVSRSGRMLYNEVYYIVNKKNLAWKSLHEDSLTYISKQTDYIYLSASKDYPILKGDFLITKTDRPSYEFLKSKKPFQPTKQYILVHLK